jgi:DNA polymerase-3 subunit epsilon
MKKITCIDFETANPFWGSICSVGVAVIEGNKITKTISRLVKPHPDYREFNRDNIRVHGIKPEMVSDAPEFDEIYKEIKPLIEGGVVAAHNTTFDVNCLRDVLTLYKIPIPSFDYICTCELSRASWEGLTNYRLKTVNAHLGHKFKQHDAGEDAIASANIIIKSMQENKAKDIYDLAEMLKVNMGKVKAGEEYILSSVKSQMKKADKFDVREVVPETNQFKKDHPLLDKELVFTGQFESGMSRRQAMQLAVNCGAQLSNYVRARTDFLVKGNLGEDGAKVRKAKKLAGTVSDIKIIGEDEFISIINK